jgi:hypothetical protein
MEGYRDTCVEFEIKANAAEYKAFAESAVWRDIASMLHNRIDDYTKAMLMQKPISVDGIVADLALRGAAHEAYDMLGYLKQMVEQGKDQ